MKKNTHFIYILIFIHTLVFSQEHRTGVSSKFRPGVMWFYTGLKPAIPEKVRKYDRLILDVTYNDWTGAKNKAFKNNWNSIGLNTSFLADIPFTKGNTVSMGVGLSYGFFKVNHNGLFIRDMKDEKTDLYNDIKSYGISKSIFKLHAVSIPLEIRFRGRNWKHIKFHLGGKFTYQFHANTSVSSKSADFVSKQVTLGFYDLNPINVAAFFRFGIRNWALFGQYNFLPIFTNTSSVKLNTFQFGLSISLF